MASGFANFLAPEATALFKLLFFRAKDVLDVENLLVIQGPALDRSYIRRWLVSMTGDDDERLLMFDALLQRHPVR